MKQARVLLAQIHAALAAMFVIVIITTTIITCIYKSLDKESIIVNNITYNDSRYSFLYPYIIHYESLDGSHTGQFKSIYKYQWDKKSYTGNKSNCIVEVRKDKDKVIDNSGVSLYIMLTLLLLALFIIITFARIALGSLDKKLSKERQDNDKSSSTRSN